MMTQYILRVFSDESNEIHPHDLRGLLDTADKLGGDTAPITLIKPAHDPEDCRWGLEIEIHGEE